MNTHLLFTNIFNVPLGDSFVYLLAMLCAFMIVVYAIPGILLVALKKRLVDKPDFRKKHKKVTPSFGGLAMYSAIIFVTSVFDLDNFFPHWNFVVAGSFLLFVTGLKDDVVAISPKSKFAAQFIASFLVVYFAGIRIGNLHGFLGIHDLPNWLSIILTTIGITFVTNAYNLIDGVDGLCGSLCLTDTLLLGVYFGYMGDQGYALASFTISGAILGFLKYNKNPARIFMGDTGSLILGFLICILSVAIVEETNLHRNGTPLSYYAGKEHLALALAMVMVPVFDTFRVFTTRIIHKTSPFKPDRRHIHHILGDSGMNANQICITLVLTSLFFVFVTVVFSMMDMNATLIILFQLFMAVGLLLVALRKRNMYFLKLKDKAETTTYEKNNALTLNENGSPMHSASEAHTSHQN
ncbi:glycosyltransferase family 4 protein [Rhizosphaericola mali]|nr:MraY family glycosyltransferase [Rhizosphaericola mali]